MYPIPGLASGIAVRKQVFNAQKPFIGHQGTGTKKTELGIAAQFLDHEVGALLDTFMKESDEGAAGSCKGEGGGTCIDRMIVCYIAIAACSVTQSAISLFQSCTAHGQACLVVIP